MRTLELVIEMLRCHGCLWGKPHNTQLATDIERTQTRRGAKAGAVYATPVASPGFLYIHMDR